MWLSPFMQFTLRAWVSSSNLIHDLIDVVFGDVLSVKQGDSFPVVGICLVKQFQAGFNDVRAGSRTN